MTDLKTSQEPVASTLTGTELIRIVQGGGNAAATATQLANVVFSSSSPTFTSQLTVNQNAAAGPAPPQASGVNVTARDSTIGGFSVDTFALQGSNAFRRANGTAALPTKLLSGDTIGIFSFKGYDAVTGYTVTQASIILNAAEDWNTATNRGTTFLFRTTPAGSGSVATAMQVQASGGISIGTSTDPGIGSLILNGSLLHPTVANAAIATVLGSVGPTGSHTTVQEWFPIKNAAGVVRYVPGF